MSSKYPLLAGTQILSAALFCVLVCVPALTNSMLWCAFGRIRLKCILAKIIFEWTQELEEILQANNLTQTYPSLSFQVFSHLLYRFAYGYNVPPDRIARTQDELVTYLEETVFRLNEDGLRGHVSYADYTISFMEEGNFYQWNEGETVIRSESKFIFNSLIQDLDYLIQENDAA